nr:unnamed protein product [Callosobruchus analis]
MFALSIQNGV